MSLGHGAIGETPISASPVSPDDLIVTVAPSVCVLATAGPKIDVVIPGPNVSSLVSATVDPTVQTFAAAAGGGAFFTVYTTLDRVVTNSDSPYQILSGTIVRYDPASTITLRCPANPVANDSFVIKNTRGSSVSDNVTVDANADDIEVAETTGTPVMVTGSFTFAARPLAAYKYVFFDGFGWMLTEKYTP